MSVEAKICGLNDPAAVAAAVDGGARYLGFNFFAASPRYVSPEESARLGAGVPAGVLKVGVVVDAGDEALARITVGAGLHMLQLHGAETPGRVAEVKALFELPVIKAVPISGADDVEKARAYEDVADRLMFDARPPEGASRPGGNALAFDWGLIRDRHWRLPWFLAGGLDADNVAEAVGASGARAVDVSSGVEDAPGRKSPDKIRAFLQAVAGL
jgi:phosphoribosylanthranilate isomerase